MNSPLYQFCVFVISAAVFGSMAAAAPQVVYVNGKVVTVDDQFSIIEGFAIEADRFIAAGASEDMLARPTAPRGWWISRGAPWCRG